MKHFDYSGKSVSRNGKLILKEGVLPTLIQFVILFFVIIEFAVFIGAGNGMPDIMPSRFEAGEETNPNIVRLIYLICSFAAAFVCAGISSHISKADEDRHTTKAFWLSILGGTFLWQAIGECSWHFGLKCEDYYVNFVRIENSSSLLLLIAFVMLLIYGAVNKSFDWGMWIFLFSFLINWAGHFAQIGTYPFVDTIFEEKAWFLYSGLGIGIPGMLFALYSMIFAAKDKKGRLFSSLMLYTFMCMISTGIRGE